MLQPRASCFAFSPDDALLAWCEGPEGRAVHVTELATMRTVTTLDGATVRALHWSSPETLRVLRQTGVDATMHAHAIPDGGEVATVALPRIGYWPMFSASHDGHVALVSREWWRWDHTERASVNAWILRGEAGDVVEHVDPFARVKPRGFAPSGNARYAMSPDGARLAIVLDTLTERTRPAALPSRVFFIALQSGEVDTHALSTDDHAELLRWVAPSRILVVFKVYGRPGSMLLIDDAGREREAARWSSPDAFCEGELALHPERDRVAFMLHRRAWGEFLCDAATVALPGREGASPIERIQLSSQEWLPDEKHLYGGVAWNAHGELLTLSVEAPDEAVLSRHDATERRVREVARFTLTGGRPHRLTLTTSPCGTRALARWNSDDTPVGEGFRHVAHIGL